MMAVGICIVGVGLMVGISYRNLQVELAYLLSGLLLFGAGQLLQKSAK